MLKAMVFILGLGVAALVIWVRVAPDDPGDWHQGSGRQELGHVSGRNWQVYREIIAEGGAERLAALDAALRALPSTRVLAGSPGEGTITYITRSKRLGFPDYTTLSLDRTPEGAVLELFARSRYGTSDFGVNRARIQALPGIPD